MTIYYVATLANYVLVEAPDETAARSTGLERLASLSSPARDINTIQIRTIRQATAEEIEFNAWHQAQIEGQGQ